MNNTSNGSDLVTGVLPRGYLEPVCGSTSALTRQVGGDHYKKLKIQPVEYIMENNIPYIEGCVIKYVTRWKDKNGVEDLRKAIHFLEILIQQQEKQNG